jgi:hypothetical protein
MPNPIKYTAGTETLALKKGNFYIGTGDVGKGPSDTTGYYQGPSPASGGYVIYLNKSGVPGNLSYHSAANDSQLISFTNNLSGTSFTSATQCLNYYATQTDKVCFNRDYEPIVTDGLIFNLDAGFTPSYSRSGTTWYDISGTNNLTLNNAPVYDSGNGGSIDFDGSDDFGISSNILIPSNQTFCVWAVREGGAPTLVSGILTNHAGVFSVGNIGINLSRTNQLAPSIGYTDGDSEYISKPTTFVTQQNVIFYATLVYVSSTNSIIWYVNGQFDSTYSLTKTPNFISYPVCVGRWDAAWNNYYFNGKVYIGQIYNKSLSASEVLQNYNAQKGRFGL